MARHVSTTSPVRSTRAKYSVCDRCSALDLFQDFEATISWTISAWSDRLSPDKLDKMIVRSLKDALTEPDLAEKIEDDLRAAKNLSEEWDLDDKPWDNYREAMAVCILQRYYDSHQGGGN